METNKSIKKYFNRKKFFTTAGTGLFGFILIKTFPFNLLAKSKKEFDNPIKIKINPSAVSRKSR